MPTPLTGTFEADFSRFFAAVDEAKVKLYGFEQGAANVDEKLTRMVDRFSGRQIIQQATLMTEAIERLEGGLSSLTDAELARVGRTAGEAVEKMKALGMDVPKGMQQIADATKGAGDATESLTSKVATMAAGYITAEAAIRLVEGAYHVMVDALKAVVAAAAESEDAEAGLLAALHAQGTAVPSVVDAYDAYASSLQKVTIYSADAVKATEGVLAQVGGVMPRDMERALQATTNLAAGLRIDLASAAMMVAKAAEGQTTALAKAGVAIVGAKGEALEFGAILDQVNTKFKGAAEAAGETFTGRLAMLKNAWNDVESAIGRAIVRNETVSAALAGLTEIVQGATNDLTGNAEANNRVSDAVIVLVKGLALGVEGLDVFQHGLQGARILLDSYTGAVLFAYEGLQQLELATQKPLAWAGSEQAAQRVREAGEAMEWASGKLDALNGDINAARATSQQWHATLAGLRGELDTLATNLESTRGHTRALKTESESLWDAWVRETENLKAHNDELTKAAEAAKQKAEADKVLASVDEDFHATVAALDDTMVQSIKHYIEAGVSQDVLAKHYEITAAQVAAVGKALAEDIAVEKLAAAQKAEFAKLDLQYWRVRGSVSHDVVAAQIAETWAWADAQKAAMEKAHTYSEEGWGKIKAVAFATIDAIVQKQEEQIPGTRAYYQKIAEEAEAAYQFALAHAQDFTGAALITLQDAAQKAQLEFADWQAAGIAAAEAVSTAADGSAAAFAKSNAQLSQGVQLVNQMTGAISTMAGVTGSVTAGTGYADWQSAAMNLTSEYVDWLTSAPGAVPRGMTWSAFTQNPAGRAGGGPVSAGTPYIVGERGPELFVPAASGAVVPGGGGTQVVVQAGAFVLNYPILDNPTALDALARTVGAALLKRVTATGARL
jgi:hypothetical protein